MSIMAYMNGNELATKSMIPGNGINLLDGTKEANNFTFTGGVDKIQDDSKMGNNKLTSVCHAWGNALKDAMITYNKSLKLVPGFYTLSFLVAGNDSYNTNTPTLSAYDGSKVLGTSNQKVINSPEFYSITFKVTTAQPTTLVIGNNGSDSLPGGSIFYCNFKLEAGVNPTPWSESVADQIQELKSELQAK